MEQSKIEHSQQIMRQTKLPIFLEGRTVEDMVPGETRAVQVYAMVVDTEYDPWLRSGYKTYSNPSENHPLIITRTDKGFEVDATLVEDEGWFANTDTSHADESEDGRLLKVLGITFEVPSY